MSTGPLEDPRDDSFIEHGERWQRGTSEIGGTLPAALGQLPGDVRPAGFKGKGPRHYQRSAQAIHDDVCEFLTIHDDLDASAVEVTVDAGIVTLRGHVGSRYDRRLAATVAEGVRGVRDVMNELRVVEAAH